ncbi:MAG: AAC(3) family N-acetyltransferase [Desulfobacteraceae bacterium]|nr:AAC(3) family N-acetyltransferase [Desulfobacteraceae bacterium]MBC2754812.1 AAC(3) family N-acetyltransferase [Desulfobacteraceae bacterium]
MRNFIAKKLSPTRKRKIKAFFNKIKKKYVDTFLSYSPADLQKKLQGLEIKQDDTIMVHSGWSPFNGFQGTAQDAIKIFKEAIGPEGTLLMVSMSYRNAAYEYFEKLKCFNVRRTSGRMGLMSEIFRRQKDVLRSLHPAHPVLAWGKEATWFTLGHENCGFSCGEGSPFEKLSKHNGKVLFFDVEFNTMTFFHYIEHVIREKLPFPLYGEKEYDLKIIDYEGQEIHVKAHAFSKEAVAGRRPMLLEKEVLKRQCFSWKKIGNTSIGVINAADALECAKNMISKGNFLHEV